MRSLSAYEDTEAKASGIHVSATTSMGRRLDSATWKGFRFLLVLVDVFPKYVEGFPPRSAAASAVPDKM